MTDLEWQALAERTYCFECGSCPAGIGDSLWRWTGTGWQHRCASVHPQVGHWDIATPYNWVTLATELEYPPESERCPACFGEGTYKVIHKHNSVTEAKCSWCNGSGRVDDPARVLEEIDALAHITEW